MNSKKDMKALMYGYSDEDRIDTDIEVKGKIIQVHNTKVRDEITTDVVLARWEEPKDKKFVLELAVIAGDCLHQVKRYYTDTERYLNAINKLPDNWQQEKQLRIQRISDIFMRRIDWLCNLNRNVANNYLVKDLLQSGIQDMQVDTDNRLSKEIKDIKNAFSNQEKPEAR